MENIKDKNLKNFYLTDLKEQETIVNIDYYERIIFVYTCRKSVAERLKGKFGEPQKTYYTNNQISGVRYEIPFNMRKEISQILSRPLLIGNM